MNANGENWIRQEKRLAIYLRDGCACLYCGASIEEGAQLTLDHVVPRSRGGRHDAGNLITACRRCNDARSDRPVGEFTARVAGYLNQGLTGEAILESIRLNTGRQLAGYLAEAKQLIGRRGSAAKVLAERIHPDAAR